MVQGAIPKTGFSMWDQSKIEWIVSILKTPALRVCVDASIQMPHHLISDMHELINEGLLFPLLLPSQFPCLKFH